ncbi:proline-rich receptor-like protein kinase PERK2 [Iris pallida]|uniref:Proline-rich receptor-like protein kinase PERK2 n=1 Tax=Iris pallida TaxID=29817 RepID=A0AAX6FIT0_IRIPA|nr:proline-rich receptor-like protein kinase PERK2 [Iris pallida]KAJ6816337.1 proline-rich receptor-like protein kinase PERK2 [Iris pallida]
MVGMMMDWLQPIEETMMNGGDVASRNGREGTVMVRRGLGHD